MGYKVRNVKDIQIQAPLSAPGSPVDKEARPTTGYNGYTVVPQQLTPPPQYQYRQMGQRTAAAGMAPIATTHCGGRCPYGQGVPVAAGTLDRRLHGAHVHLQPGDQEGVVARAPPPRPSLLRSPPPQLGLAACCVGWRTQPRALCCGTLHGGRCKYSGAYSTVRGVFFFRAGH